MPRKKKNIDRIVWQDAHAALLYVDFLIIYASFGTSLGWGVSEPYPIPKATGLFPRVAELLKLATQHYLITMKPPYMFITGVQHNRVIFYQTKCKDWTPKGYTFEEVPNGCVFRRKLNA